MLPTRRPRPSPADESVGYRADIDGLRALAILLVVVYHVWWGRVSGGVDVFLMISAFFLTESFARRLRQGGPLRPVTFWVRKFRRLLPAAAVTIFAVLLGTGFIVHAVQWPAIWREAWASLFYMQNWELAFQAIDYYARETVLPSPLQHFWSLSVQGQVFLIWPVLFLLAAWIIRRTRFSVTTVLLTVFGLVFVLSLAFSIAETATNQQFAYFDTRTRLWEFALGSLVAIVLPLFRAPATVRLLLGWTGLAGIVLCGVVLDVQGGFPGYLALWPTLCTAAIILAGPHSARGGPAVVLASAPLRMLGRDAYALYLVHWPILIFALTLQGRTEAGVWTGLAVILASLVAARLLSMLVERPLRQWRWADRSLWRGVVVVGVSLAVVAAPLATWQVVQRSVVESAEAEAVTAREEAREAEIAAQAAAPDATDTADLTLIDSPIVPVATALDQEWVVLGPLCEGRFAVGDDVRPGSEPLVSTCRQTPLVENPSRTILVIGSSHTEQMMGTLIPLAEQNRWQLVSLLLGGCTIAPEDEPTRLDAEECRTWRAAAMEYAISLAPDAVMTVVTTTVPEGQGEVLQRGISKVVDRLTAAGIHVIAVRDNPRFTFDPYLCMSQHGRSAPPCVVPADLLFAEVNPAQALAGDGVVIVDLTSEICPGGLCVPVIGNIAVYLDTNHLTETFARALAPVMGARLAAGGFP